MAGRRPTPPTLRRGALRLVTVLAFIAAAETLSLAPASAQMLQFPSRPAPVKKTVPTAGPISASAISTIASSWP
jgi:hypothetical protein